MQITEEVVNILAPNHSRTSCSDDNLSNAFGGWNGKYNEDTGKRVIIYPRCNRCYLLSNLGFNINSLDFKFEVFLTERK